jgi:hypothetical protein
MAKRSVFPKKDADIAAFYQQHAAFYSSLARGNPAQGWEDPDELRAKWQEASANLYRAARTRLGLDRD